MTGNEINENIEWNQQRREMERIRLGECEANAEILRHDLATERAAREQAEAELADANHQLLLQISANDQANRTLELTEEKHQRQIDCWKSEEVSWLERLRQAERERDTALARVKELEAVCDAHEETERELCAVNRAAEAALASARATIGRVAEYVGYLEQDIAAARKNREPQTGMHVPYHGAFCSAPISTIKDLERFARSMRDLLTSHPAPVAAQEHECDNDDCQRCHHIGALPAPVAARERFAAKVAEIEKAYEGKEFPGVLIGPAPVAATSMSLLAAASKVTKLWADLSSQELYGEALDELLQDDRQELEDAMQALRDAERGPVAAPCAGCAAARELLVRSQAATEYRLGDWVRDRDAWLKEHP
jgi:hypothetical protein